MPMKPSILLPWAGRLVELGDGAVADPLVFLGQAEVERLVGDRNAVLAEEDAEQAVEVAGDLRQERRHVGSAERNARGAGHLAALLLDLLGVGVLGGLAPGVVRVQDVPALADLAGHVGCKAHRLRRRIVERTEGVAVALAGGDGGVEANADHVDDFILGEHRHAGETDVGEETALVRVDVVFDEQLLGFAPADVGFELVVGDQQFDGTAADAAHLVDAVDGHLRADQRGLATGRSGTRERLQRADLEGLCLAEGWAPGCRHQHGGA